MSIPRCPKCESYPCHHSVVREEREAREWAERTTWALLGSDRSFNAAWARFRYKAPKEKRA